MIIGTHRPDIRAAGIFFYLPARHHMFNITVPGRPPLRASQHHSDAKDPFPTLIIHIVKKSP